MLLSIPLTHDLVSALIATDLPQSQVRRTLSDAVIDAKVRKSLPRDTKGQMPALTTLHTQ